MEPEEPTVPVAASSTTESTTTAPLKQPDSTDFLARLMGFAIIGSPLYYVFVWRNLPAGTTTRWLITGGLLVALIVIAILAKRRTSRLFELAGNFIIVLFVILGAAIVSIYFANTDRIALFKLFTIAYFAFLPAWLYLQFISTRGKTIWEEYVINLFRLRIDHYAHLPMPPRHSIFYTLWQGAASKDTQSSGTLAAESIYKKKFEALYGPVENLTLFRAENMFPVALATLIISVGWVIVVEPATIFNRVLLPQPTSVGGPMIPMEEFRFGFLGAYFYILQMLVRRYFQHDLKTHAYVNATMRIIVVLLLVWVLSEVLSDSALKDYRVALAFIIGVFPQVGWQVLVETVKSRFKGTVKSLDLAYPLSDLDGLTTWYESRLLEEGIEDMQNLATCNLVDAMLNTRIPIERLVDWVDQSLLNLHLGSENKQREKLRSFGIRTATDLENAFASTPDDRDAELRQKLEAVLNETPDEPSRLRIILKTLSNEPNLTHVREWKSFETHVLTAG